MESYLVPVVAATIFVVSSLIGFGSGYIILRIMVAKMGVETRFNKENIENLWETRASKDDLVHLEKFVIDHSAATSLNLSRITSVETEIKSIHRQLERIEIKIDRRNGNSH